MAKTTCAFILDDSKQCSETAVCRGLCKKHWTYCWKNQMLPPKKPRVPMVMTKLYIPKPQVTTLRRLSKARSEKMSALLRSIIDEWLTEHAGSGE